MRYFVILVFLCVSACSSVEIPGNAGCYILDGAITECFGEDAVMPVCDDADIIDIGFPAGSYECFELLEIVSQLPTVGETRGASTLSPVQQ